MTKAIMENKSNPWDVLTTQTWEMPAQCASPSCTPSPPSTTLAVLWGPNLCIKETHRALAQPRHPSILWASSASCSSRLHVQWGFWCMVLRTCRTMNSPQCKLSYMSRHTRTKCVPCLQRVTPSQALQHSSTHPPKQWMLCHPGMGPIREMKRAIIIIRRQRIHEKIFQGVIVMSRVCDDAV